jgi:gliding motility-associated-like protein
MNRDSVKVRVTDHVNLDVMKDTTICEGDAIQLKIISDGLNYSWTPALNMANAKIKNPTVVLKSSAICEVTAFTGGCYAKKQILISTIPYPVANAGKDTIICYNTIATLHGSMDGNSFSWSPFSNISNIQSINPAVKPVNTTSYILSAYNDKGCPKPGNDTVLVRVLPQIHALAGSDTLVVTGQPLQMSAYGGVTYQWSPAIGLSSATISNPVATYSQPSNGIRYKVFVYNEAQCVDSAFTTVKVYKTLPSVFVPNAFTPNGDGRNERLRPIAIGMKKIEYFSIYNRWGQPIFSSAENGTGWDGTLGGRQLAPDTYLWVLRALDFTGTVHIKKGTVILIR